MEETFISLYGSRKQFFYKFAEKLQPSLYTYLSPYPYCFGTIHGKVPAKHLYSCTVRTAKTKIAIMFGKKLIK